MHATSCLGLGGVTADTGCPTYNIPVRFFGEKHPKNGQNLSNFFKMFQNFAQIGVHMCPLLLICVVSPQKTVNWYIRVMGGFWGATMVRITFVWYLGVRGDLLRPPVVVGVCVYTLIRPQTWAHGDT